MFLQFCKMGMKQFSNSLITFATISNFAMKKLLPRIVLEKNRFGELLHLCSKRLLLYQGVQVHGSVVKMGLWSDMMLSNYLIGMYGKCGKVETARKVFDRMIDRNVVSWTALMRGYVQNEYAEESLVLFCEMELWGVKPNDFTFSTNLKACIMLSAAGIGMQIHGSCVKTGFDKSTIVGNSIIDMYSKCGRIGDAALLFEVMEDKDLVSWNSIIAGYTQAGFIEKALVLFQKLQEDGRAPDDYTLTSVFKACTSRGAVRQGNQIHALLITSGFPYLVQDTVSGALIDLYVKCKKLSEAEKVFSQIERKSVVPWSALIFGYAQEGNIAEAMSLFRRLRESDIHVDDFLLSGILGTFADFALVEQGKQLHAYTIKVPAGLDVNVCNSIVDMYLKCGMMDEAEILFIEMPARNVISWTVMITGYGKQGLGNKAISLFNEMQLHNIRPDDVTFLAILWACSHSGLLEEGREYFSRLLSDHQIKARVEHYACMVDLLGRAGRLQEAKNIIETMPLEPNVGIWQTLLSACRVHGNVELAREVGDILLRLDSDNPVNYVMMSNIYVGAGDWRECERIRELVKAKGLRKEAGRSWVGIDKEVHYFYGGDDTHPLIENIHQVLKEMERKVKQELGYVYGLQYALHDVEEESKEESLRFHSEKLAIGLALACGGWEDGRVIRVFKNLRVCGDCHEFIKGLSKILNIVFVVRDASRFHSFENGQCSCRDYW